MWDDILASLFGVICGLHVLSKIVGFQLSKIVDLRVIPAYIVGMCVYRMKNWKGDDKELVAMGLATKDEFVEFKEEVEKRNLYGMFDEWNDTWHGAVQWIGIFSLGWKMWFSYPIIFVLCPWSAWKQGSRFLHGGCVRSKNHHNEDGSPKNHECDGYKPNSLKLSEVMQAVWEEIKRQTYPF